MAFGIYVHIPYCLQRCTYCDFATYEQSQIMPPPEYVSLVKEEIRQKSSCFNPKYLNTIYFGGGTPSLIPAELIVSILNQLTSCGFTRDQQTEITLEINPATVDPKKMELYLSAGINRFSVGAQTFDDALLKSVRREHTALQTKETLTLLKSFGVNFSFDILFALPGQTLSGLEQDLEQVVKFHPQHVSPYCLTVPEGHVLSKIRPLEDVQIKMFDLIAAVLHNADYFRYEISNFCQPRFESKHNSLYWDDQEYWGVGLGSHSYSPQLGQQKQGLRYWNHNSINEYQKQIIKGQGKSFSSPEQNLPATQFEWLELHQSVSDFCHISLRRSKGLILDDFVNKFGDSLLSSLRPALAQLVEQDLLQPTALGWALTDHGLMLSNQVFGSLTFLKDELCPRPTGSP